MLIGKPKSRVDARGTCDDGTVVGTRGCTGGVGTDACDFNGCSTGVLRVPAAAGDGCRLALGLPRARTCTVYIWHLEALGASTYDVTTHLWSIARLDS